MKYAPFVLDLRFNSAIAIFKNGSCVELCDAEKEEGESWEDFAIRILKTTREDFYPEEYGPDYVDEDEKNEYGEKPFCSNSKGYINLFFWGEEYFCENCSLLHEIVDADLANPEVVHIIFNENKK